MTGKREHTSALRPWILFGMIAVVLLAGGLVLAANQLAQEIAAVIGSEF